MKKIVAKVLLACGLAAVVASPPRAAASVILHSNAHDMQEPQGRVLDKRFMWGWMYGDGDECDDGDGDGGGNDNESDDDGDCDDGIDDGDEEDDGDGNCGDNDNDEPTFGTTVWGDASTSDDTDFGTTVDVPRPPHTRPRTMTLLPEIVTTAAWPPPYPTLGDEDAPPTGYDMPAAAQPGLSGGVYTVQKPPPPERTLSGAGAPRALQPPPAQDTLRGDVSTMDQFSLAEASLSADATGMTPTPVQGTLSPDTSTMDQPEATLSAHASTMPPSPAQGTLSQDASTIDQPEATLSADASTMDRPEATLSVDASTMAPSPAQETLSHDTSTMVQPEATMTAHEPTHMAPSPMQETLSSNEAPAPEAEPTLDNGGLGTATETAAGAATTLNGEPSPLSPQRLSDLSPSETFAPVGGPSTTPPALSEGGATAPAAEAEATLSTGSSLSLSDPDNAALSEGLETAAAVSGELSLSQIGTRTPPPSAATLAPLATPRPPKPPLPAPLQPTLQGEEASVSGDEKEPEPTLQAGETPPTDLDPLEDEDSTTTVIVHTIYHTVTRHRPSPLAAPTLQAEASTAADFDPLEDDESTALLDQPNATPPPELQVGAPALWPGHPMVQEEEEEEEILNDPFGETQTSSPLPDTLTEYNQTEPVWPLRDEPVTTNSSTAAPPSETGLLEEGSEAVEGASPSAPNGDMGYNATTRTASSATEGLPSPTAVVTTPDVPTRTTGTGALYTSAPLYGAPPQPVGQVENTYDMEYMTVSAPPEQPRPSSVIFTLPPTSFGTTVETSGSPFGTTVWVGNSPSLTFSGAADHGGNGEYTYTVSGTSPVVVTAPGADPAVEWSTSRVYDTTRSDGAPGVYTVRADPAAQVVDTPTRHQEDDADAFEVGPVQGLSNDGEGSVKKPTHGLGNKNMKNNVAENGAKPTLHEIRWFNHTRGGNVTKHSPSTPARLNSTSYNASHIQLLNNKWGKRPANTLLSKRMESPEDAEAITDDDNITISESELGDDFGRLSTLLPPFPVPVPIPTNTSWATETVHAGHHTTRLDADLMYAAKTATVVDGSELRKDFGQLETMVPPLFPPQIPVPSDSVPLEPHAGGTTQDSSQQPPTQTDSINPPLSRPSPHAQPARADTDTLVVTVPIPTTPPHHGPESSATRSTSMPTHTRPIDDEKCRWNDDVCREEYECDPDDWECLEGDDDDDDCDSCQDDNDNSEDWGCEEEGWEEACECDDCYGDDDDWSDDQQGGGLARNAVARPEKTVEGEKWYNAGKEFWTVLLGPDDDDDDQTRGATTATSSVLPSTQTETSGNLSTAVLPYKVLSTPTSTPPITVPTITAAATTTASFQTLRGLDPYYPDGVPGLEFEEDDDDNYDDDDATDDYGDADEVEVTAVPVTRSTATPTAPPLLQKRLVGLVEKFKEHFEGKLPGGNGDCDDDSSDDDDDDDSDSDGEDCNDEGQNGASNDQDKGQGQGGHFHGWPHDRDSSNPRARPRPRPRPTTLTVHVTDHAADPHKVYKTYDDPRTVYVTKDHDVYRTVEHDIYHTQTVDHDVYYTVDHDVHHTIDRPVYHTVDHTVDHTVEHPVYRTVDHTVEHTIDQERPIHHTRTVGHDRPIHHTKTVGYTRDRPLYHTIDHTKVLTRAGRIGPEVTVTRPLPTHTPGCDDDDGGNDDDDGDDDDDDDDDDDGGWDGDNDDNDNGDGNDDGDGEDDDWPGEECSDDDDGWDQDGCDDDGDDNDDGDDDDDDNDNGDDCGPDMCDPDDYECLDESYCDGDDCDYDDDDDGDGYGCEPVYITVTTTATKTLTSVTTSTTVITSTDYSQEPITSSAEPTTTVFITDTVRVTRHGMPGPTPVYNGPFDREQPLREGFEVMDAGPATTTTQAADAPFSGGRTPLNDRMDIPFDQREQRGGGVALEAEEAAPEPMDATTRQHEPLGQRELDEDHRATSTTGTMDVPFDQREASMNHNVDAPLQDHFEVGSVSTGASGPAPVDMPMNQRQSPLENGVEQHQASPPLRQNALETATPFDIPFDQREQADGRQNTGPNGMKFTTMAVVNRLVDSGKNSTRGPWQNSTSALETLPFFTKNTSRPLVSPTNGLHNKTNTTQRLV